MVSEEDCLYFKATNLGDRCTIQRGYVENCYGVCRDFKNKEECSGTSNKTSNERPVGGVCPQCGLYVPATIAERSACPD